MIQRQLIVSCLWLFVLGPSIAFAGSEASEADKEACTPDVFRLCQDFIPNEGPIVTCLTAKRSELSLACLHVMFPPAQPAPAVKTPRPAIKTQNSPAHRSKKRHKMPKST